MKYYKLTHIGVNRGEIGVSPQSSSGEVGDIQKDFIPREGIIDFDFKLPIPKLKDKAIATTLLDVGMIPFVFLVVNNSFIDLVKNYKIGDFQNWPIKVLHKKEILEDYNIFLLNRGKQSKYIDFKNSEFFVGSLKDFQYVGDNIKISDYENFLSTKEVLKKSGLLLKCNQVTINLKEVKEDIFRLYIDPVGGYYVSERLKKEIIEQGFTGMVFNEIEESVRKKRVKVIY
jgi:hypothetical protein